MSFLGVVVNCALPSGRIQGRQVRKSAVVVMQTNPNSVIIMRGSNHNHDLQFYPCDMAFQGLDTGK